MIGYILYGIVFLAFLYISIFGSNFSEFQNNGTIIGTVFFIEPIKIGALLLILIGGAVYLIITYQEITEKLKAIPFYEYHLGMSSISQTKDLIRAADFIKKPSSVAKSDEEQIVNLIKDFRTAYALLPEKMQRWKEIKNNTEWLRNQTQVDIVTVQQPVAFSALFFRHRDDQPDFQITKSIFSRIPSFDELRNVVDPAIPDAEIQKITSDTENILSSLRNNPHIFGGWGSTDVNNINVWNVRIWYGPLYKADYKPLIDAYLNTAYLVDSSKLPSKERWGPSHNPINFEIK